VEHTIETFILKAGEEATFITDICGLVPKYVYLGTNQEVYSSENLSHMVEFLRNSGQLIVRKKSMAYMLQSGLVPYPDTIFENLLVVGIGDCLVVRSDGAGLTYSFKHQYPFLFSEKSEIRDLADDDLFEVVRRNVEKYVEDDTFLFHSAGKDSNLILSTLVESDLKEKITLVTHRSKGSHDESRICSKLATKYNFKQVILSEIDSISNRHIEIIRDYFKELPLPSIDNVSLAYPLYSDQLPELRGSNIMTGDGNDFYMGTPPSFKDQFKYNLSSILSPLRSSILVEKSESVLGMLLRTAPEWNRMEGFNTHETTKILGVKLDVSEHWRAESKLRKGWLPVDFKTDLYSTLLIQQVYIQKFRLACYVWESKLSQPLMDPNIAKAFWKLPNNKLYRPNGKNKIVIRDILKDKIGLDSDSIGKKGYNYDSTAVMLQNWNWVKSEILNCEMWNRNETEKILMRLYPMIGGGGIRERMAARLVYRIFLLSLWCNHSKYARNGLVKQ